MRRVVGSSVANGWSATSTVAPASAFSSVDFRGSAGRQDQVVVVPATGEVAIQVVRSFDVADAGDRLFGPATRIPAGRDDVTLGVSARGQQVTVLLGGAEVARAIDPVAATGGVGVVANAARGQALVIEVRALRVYNP
jgi:hypothetical protein